MTTLTEARADAGDPSPEATQFVDLNESQRCRDCGAPCDDADRFCRTCGAAIAEDAERSRLVADPLVGMLVGQRYRILARIGSGGMGAVYRVRHEQLGKQAAMKLLHGDLARDPSMVKRFVREARAVSRLNDPHTVSVFDFGQSGGLVFLVMELLQGRDLGHALSEDGPFSPGRVARVARQVAASLDEAHALGIVHRDLKPQNLFACDTPSGTERIKVLDFGLAKLLEGREESAALTQVGTVMGTPYYMSPEQIEDTHVGPASDVYGLGAVLYRLLTDSPPFQHPSPLGILHRHLHDPVPRLSDTDPALEPLDAVIERAMAKDPSDRFASVGAFASAVEHAVQSISGTTPTPLRLAPDAARDRATDVVGTREEFERFERRWRARRWLRAGIPVLLVPAALGAVVAFAADAEQYLPAREQEPNDQVLQASTLRAGPWLRATLPPRGRDGREDRDLFRFVPESLEGRRRIEVVPTPSVGVSATVYNAAREVVATQEGAPGESLAFDGLPGTRGLVLRVSAAQGDGDYRVRLRHRPTYHAEEREPNGTASLARPLRDGSPVVGTFGWPGDTDWFLLPWGEVDTRYELMLEPVPRGDVAIVVVDEQGTEVLRLDDAGAGEAEAHTFEVAAADVVGRPRVRLEVEGPVDAALTYTLTVERLAPDAEPR